MIRIIADLPVDCNGAILIAIKPGHRRGASRSRPPDAGGGRYNDR